MNTTNIVNFNGVTINKENILGTYFGKIITIKENRYINKSSWKETNGKEIHEIIVRARFDVCDMSVHHAWIFNADDEAELEEFRNIGFKLGQEIIFYYMMNGDGNKFELVTK